ncbi:MAG: type II toxin-antitoxin system RelE/ParE family toxin [Hyphomonadaceae bacterium]|nr:type II toxin-antitoxin system RelE/ParE family toxin [Hyphomonadaceae bacterium]
MSAYRLTRAAAADLEAIWDYTANTWSIAQAETYTRLLKRACEDLVAGRLLGTPIEDVRAGYRKALVGSHVLFVRSADDGVVEIVRILHQRMDIDRALQTD